MNAPALIVIDMLNDFLQHGHRPRGRGLFNPPTRSVGILRGRSRPIVWVRQGVFQPDLRDAFPEMRGEGNTHHNTRNRRNCRLLCNWRSLRPMQVVIRNNTVRFMAPLSTASSPVSTRMAHTGGNQHSMGASAWRRSTLISGLAGDPSAAALIPMTANITTFRCDI